ncbi:hypothetical protein B0H17DRAFT_1100933 [Mycena rosella]|uniref:Uncharacterized protein n=1 Tax=Mycena rosella TaxID=1033263 RepID=A0AAD7G430_MYCRO|nr:hypothetical protein B0H17DRAFT_1100933 [Mycena rosella]
MSLDHLRAEIRDWETALHAHDSGDFRGSLRLFEPLGDTSKIVVNMALLHDRLGERAEAIKDFTRAIELDKYLAIAYFQRGVLYFYGEQYAEAAEDFAEAQRMMRDHPVLKYEALGLDYQLQSTAILFNKWLTLSRMGETKESAVVLQSILKASPPPDMEATIDNAIQNSGQGCNPYSLPMGTLYRPSASMKTFLSSAGQALNAMPATPAPSTRAPSTLPSLRSASSDISSTFLPSVSSHKGHRKHKSSSSSSYKGSPLSTESPDTPMSAVVHAPKRAELNRVIGPDMMKPMTEIHSVPCAGVRIAHGPLSGLMAWRFFVQLDASSNRKSKMPAATRGAVITNFILDTGSENSYVPAETLAALDYHGDTTPGAEVTLRIQGVRTKCIVAHSEDAGRVGLSFMTAGSLTYYFDAGLVAPVLYDGSRERPANVPRTIRAEDLPPRSWLLALKSRILSIFAFSS